MTALSSIKRAGKNSTGQWFQALKGINLEVQQATFLRCWGPTGRGKSHQTNRYPFVTGEANQVQRSRCRT